MYIQISVIILCGCWIKAGVSHCRIFFMKLTDLGFEMQKLGRNELYLAPFNILIVFVVSPFLKELINKS